LLPGAVLIQRVAVEINLAAPIGNQNAVKENRRWANALTRAIAQDDGERLRKAAEALLTAASVGEPWAVKELADRLDGKAAQSVTIGGDKDAPLHTETVVRFVKPDGAAG
jgi:hypothetical protein